MSGVIAHLDDAHPQFPSVGSALCEPNGLLAMGGNLKPETLIHAYQRGIFPWCGPAEPIMWWSPDPRAIIYTEQLHLPKSLRRTLRKCSHYRITMDNAFEQVMQACAARSETWIRPDLIDSFCTLHEMGYSHSVEVWDKETLVGGLYGIAIGSYFSGESMFSIEPNTSKIALAHLAHQLGQWNCPMIDCQQPSHHLQLMGAQLLPREEFLKQLEHLNARDNHRIPQRPWEYKSTELPL